MTTAALQKHLARLPHGPEFRFLDELTALEPGRKGRARFTVRGDAHFLRGHFPDEPLVPGVLLVEAIAQLAGVVAQSDPSLPPLPRLRLTAIRNVKITGPARPGDSLGIEASLIARLGALIQAEGSVECCGTTLVTAELVLVGAS